MERDRIYKVIIENVKIPYKSGVNSEDFDAEALNAAVKSARRLLGKTPAQTMIHKKSIDARRKNDIKFVYSICASIEGAPLKEIDKLKKHGVKLYSAPEFDVAPGKIKPNGRIVIVGFGPAGMFCGVELAKRGYRPVIYERGGSLEERVSKVEKFIKGGELDVNSNIQFGAGGAGTFSDGKLTTRINDPLISYVLSLLKDFGAPEDIEWKAKPHIGTDVLRNVVSSIDSYITKHGGEIRYNSKVEFSSDGEALLDGEKIDYEALVLAVGHSARDTYSELIENGFLIEPKPFSVGVRIEHLQSFLDEAMFGDFAGDKSLGRAEYNVSARNGARGAYSFCMCPGGEVVPAASEQGTVVTNGMSNRMRDGRNANSAIAVSVLPDDYGRSPMCAIEFQRNLERKAFSSGGGAYAAPCQTVGSFLGKGSNEIKSVFPTYMNSNVKLCNMREILPPFVCDTLAFGLGKFDERIKGFAACDVPLTGVETRTSAPVRIMRNEDLQAVGHNGIYPCGEGAGYAGGIMSAAIDGLRVAEKIISKYSPE